MKRILAVAMALALVFALLPTLAFAEETNVWTPGNAADLIADLTQINAMPDPTTPTEYTINLTADATYSITRALSISYNINKKILINGNGAILDGTAMGSNHGSGTYSGINTYAQDLTINGLTIQNMGAHGINTLATTNQMSTVELTNVTIKNCYKAAVCFHGKVIANNLITEGNNTEPSDTGANDWGTFNGGDQNGFTPVLIINGGSFNDLGKVNKDPDGEPVAVKFDDNNQTIVDGEGNITTEQKGLGLIVKLDAEAPEVNVVIAVNDVPEGEAVATGYGFENNELVYMDPVLFETVQAVEAEEATEAQTAAVMALLEVVEVETPTALLAKVEPVVVQPNATIESASFHGNSNSIVKMGVDPTFIVTIPAAVDFGILSYNADPAVYAEKPFDVSISEAYLEADHQVTVTVGTINNMTAGNDKDIEYKLFSEANEVIPDGVFATFAAGLATGTQTGSVRCYQNQIKYAGSYSGTMTFVITYEAVPVGP